MHMEKRKPHYRLETALNGGTAMGLEESQMRVVVCALARKNLVKSMTTKFDHTIWQDVYHAMTPIGERASVKVTGYTA